MSVFLKVKKYLFLLSVFFSVAIIAHLIYAYLFDGSAKYPIVWGTVSVWFVWEMPSINPLEISTNPTNDYILQFLYKSLLKYDIKTRRMEGDLANCDLWKDFSKIKCFIKSDNYWSDGTPITKDDVFATYNAIKNTWANKSMKQVLDAIDISDKGDYIEFASKNADVLLLDSFAIPIMKKAQVDEYLAGNNISNGPITSWDYIFWKKELDDKYNIKKITVFRKEWGWIKDVYISKFVFKFFSDPNSLSKNEDTLNLIFEDSNTKKLSVSPRFLSYKYTLPQYIWMFLNVDRIADANLRKFIIFQLDNANFNEIYWKEHWKIVANPFFTNESISPVIKNKNISSILNSLGFYKKDELIWNLSKKLDAQIKPQVTVAAIPNSVYFATPSNKKISFTQNTSEILISWNVPVWTEAVYIDDYKLTSFKIWNTKFYFRAKKEYLTLKQGVNYYSLSTEVWGKKVKRETITVYAYDKAEDLEKKKLEINESLTKTLQASKADNEKAAKNKEEQLAKIGTLDPIYYYDSNLNRYTLNLVYSSNWPVFWDLAEKIKNELKIIWIDVNIKETDQKRTENIVKWWEKNYDMILTWVNHGLYYYNISPFFHSGQAKEWFNFSKIKNIPLDVLLEKLKSSTLSDEKLSSIEKESLFVLKNEAVVKTFYSPYSVFYVDKNLKNIDKAEMFPYSYNTHEAIKNSYIKEDWVIDYTKKSLLWFLSWITNHL
ncbi:MAG: hypothetical protein ACD_3C00174G0003 [uncultured bacterium (gcode 4)]|uniref:Solute-binding protein family 5 domain-containing protein n=1 Tax=uncultured bacterium (gcode 4) TaxID=1234023 RepID=K2F9B8_9BACT|nr:MAG: hypothetical protein ACD_3C00174G0003 [uncultured bacterium (gcode 4)]